MNKIIKQIFFPLILVLLMGGCNNDPEYHTLDTPSDQMKITASQENVVLQKVDETKEAISFSWQKATDRGANTKLVYYFRLYHAEMKSMESELIRIDEGVSSISWSVRELNNLLHSWKIIPGDGVTLEAEVLAIVDESTEYMKPEISITRFNAIGYNPSNKLYLTVEIDNQKRNLEMNMLAEGIYDWIGMLDPCNFWFIRNIETGIPTYMKGSSDNSLIYSGTGTGDSFNLGKTANYQIKVDLISLTVTITEMENKLFLITSKNGVEQIRALNELELGTDVYYLQDDFELGTEFRFVREQGVAWPAYVKGTTDTKLEMKNMGSEMFKVNKTANYVMTVNMRELSLIFLDVYTSSTGVIGVVGGSVRDARWDAGKATRDCVLTQKDLINSPEIISYTGVFEYNPSGSNDDNAFKFVGNTSWTGQLYALQPAANPFDSSQSGVSIDDSQDRKFVLPAGTVSGIYTLELNLHTMKIIFVKQ